MKPTRICIGPQSTWPGMPMSMQVYSLCFTKPLLSAFQSSQWHIPSLMSFPEPCLGRVRRAGPNRNHAKEPTDKGHGYSDCESEVGDFQIWLQCWCCLSLCIASSVYLPAAVVRNDYIPLQHWTVIKVSACGYQRFCRENALLIKSNTWTRSLYCALTIEKHTSNNKR